MLRMKLCHVWQKLRKKKKKPRYVLVIQDLLTCPSFSAKVSKGCLLLQVQLGEPPVRSHCFVPLPTPQSIVRAPTDTSAAAASSHLAKWPGNNTQMKWQAIKSKCGSCRERQNSPCRQGYCFVFMVFNWALQFKCAGIGWTAQRKMKVALCKTL